MSSLSNICLIFLVYIMNIILLNLEKKTIESNLKFSMCKRMNKFDKR